MNIADSYAKFVFLKENTTLQNKFLQFISLYLYSLESLIY